MPVQKATSLLTYGMFAARTATTLLLLAVAATISRAAPIPVKVVVVTMFERGADTGDAPGELQYWVERNKLDRVLPFPAGFHDLRMNRDGVLAILTGVGTAKSAAAIMALGMDPRFDLTHAYWLVAGIAVSLAQASVAADAQSAAPPVAVEQLMDKVMMGEPGKELLMLHRAAGIVMVKRPLERNRLIRPRARIKRYRRQESLEIEIESRWTEANQTRRKVQSDEWFAGMRDIADNLLAR